MTPIPRQGRRTGGILAVAAALTALCFALLASSPALNASALGTGCGPHVDAVPGEATAKQMGKALRCLINQERAERGRREVRFNRDLAGIARRHTKLMVSEDCFTHQCEGERPLRQRIASSPYMAAGGRFGYGENLGCSRTPQAMLNAWMGTSFHRKVILDKRFRQVGTGAKRGSPYPSGSGSCSPGRQFVTYTVIFAWRKPAG